MKKTKKQKQAKVNKVEKISFETPKKSIDLFIEGATNKLNRYDEINRTIKELELEKKSIEKTIQENMNGCEEVYINNRKITYKTQSRVSIDTKLLKLEHPELVERYTKISTYKIFKM